MRKKSRESSPNSQQDIPSSSLPINYNVSVTTGTKSYRAAGFAESPPECFDLESNEEEVIGFINRLRAREFSKPRKARPYHV